ncbi:hypothetical protein PG989_000495 [Apiospora arundinis]
MRGSRSTSMGKITCGSMGAATILHEDVRGSVEQHPGRKEFEVEEEQHGGGGRDNSEVDGQDGPVPDKQAKFAEEGNMSKREVKRFVIEQPSHKGADQVQGSSAEEAGIVGMAEGWPQDGD